MLNIDLSMTILDIAGVNLSTVNMDGQSFLPQMVSVSWFSLPVSVHVYLYSYLFIFFYCEFICHFTCFYAFSLQYLSQCSIISYTYLKTIYNFFFFVKEINTVIYQGCIKLIKSHSKDMYDVNKRSVSNKCCSFCSLKKCIVVSTNIIE